MPAETEPTRSSRPSRELWPGLDSIPLQPGCVSLITCYRLSYYLGNCFQLPSVWSVSGPSSALWSLIQFHVWSHIAPPNCISSPQAGPGWTLQTGWLLHLINPSLLRPQAGSAVPAPFQLNIKCAQVNWMITIQTVFHYSVEQLWLSQPGPPLSRVIMENRGIIHIKYKTFQDPMSAICIH